MIAFYTGWPKGLNIKSRKFKFVVYHILIRVKHSFYGYEVYDFLSNQVEMVVSY